MTKPVDIRAHIVNVFRRDLIGPGPQDSDLAGERLNESPRAGIWPDFLAPAKDPLSLDGDDDDSNPSAQEEMELDVEEPDADGTGGAATDNEEPETPNARRRFLPSSIGLTVLLDPDIHYHPGVRLVGRLSYRTATALRRSCFPNRLPEEIGEGGEGQSVSKRPLVEWVRSPKQRTRFLCHQSIDKPRQSGSGASKRG